MGREGPEIAASLEQLYRDHLPAGEARTYLLVDSRAPVGEHEPGLIVGTFVMPLGDPVILVAAYEEGGVHHGNFRYHEDGQLCELPIGEVRTPEGKVFRLDQ